MERDEFVYYRKVIRDLPSPRRRQPASRAAREASVPGACLGLTAAFKHTLLGFFFNVFVLVGFVILCLSQERPRAVFGVRFITSCVTRVEKSVINVRISFSR